MHKKARITTYRSLSQKNNEGLQKPKRKSYMVPLDDPVSDASHMLKDVEKKQTQHNFSKTAQQLREANKPEENPIDDDDDFQKIFKVPTKIRKPPNIFAPKPAFTMPKKASSLTRSTEKSQEMLHTFEQAKEEDEFNADKMQCPFCSQYLIPLTRSIQLALNEIYSRDKGYEEKQREKENASSSFSRPVDIVNKREVSNTEKDTFCKLHKLELEIKPDGVRKGYPTKVAFENLGGRIQNFDMELKDIICNKITSDYRGIAEEAYEKWGLNKARSTTSVMHRFEKTLPGYYGPKGANVILGHLVEMYLKTGYLKRKLDSQQLPLEFLQQVLVPEVGFRLIRQDISKKEVVPNATEKAKAIMEASRDYGNAMFPVENQDIEEPIVNDDVISEPTFFTVSDDDSDDDSITSLASSD